MKRLATFVLGVGMLSVATSADAQLPRAERPYRGLFGGSVGETGQLLTASGSLGGGYDDDVFADQGGGFTAPPGPSNNAQQTQSGTYGLMSGGLQYSLDRSRVSFGGSVGLATRRYSAVDGFVTAYNMSAGGSWRATRRITVTASQAGYFQPFLTLQVLPRVFDLPIGQLEAPTLDFDAGEDRQDRDSTRHTYVASDTTAEMSMTVTRRGSFGVGYSRRTGDFGDDQRTVTQTRYARYTQALSKGLSARIGYGYSDGRYEGRSDAKRRGVHNLDAGVDFSRALSFSRRTTLKFSTGTSALVEEDRTHYRAIGNANLNHELGRSWNVGVSYSRTVEFLPNFSEPVLLDALNVGVAGMVNRRVNVFAGGGAAIGGVGFANSATDLETYFANVGTTYALSRYLGLGVNYFYYRFTFPQDALLAPGMSREVDRHGVRAFLAMWVPLFHRVRSPDAPR